MSFQPNPLLEFTQRELKEAMPKRPRKGATFSAMPKRPSKGARRARKPQKKTTDRVGSNELGVDLDLVPESRVEMPRSKANVRKPKTRKRLPIPPKPTQKPPRVSRAMLMNRVKKKKKEECDKYKNLSRKTMAQLHELL
jgi:hypothetical protein